ncbi:MAG: hypothetical protein ACOY82_06580 [Pseudomonadota bacterium]
MPSPGEGLRAEAHDAEEGRFHEERGHAGQRPPALAISPRNAPPAVAATPARP